MPEVEELELTNEQANALSEIEKPLKENRYAAFLLHGVTGSGKTEIYIRAMRAALLQGRAAMMLVPEIALTPVFSRRLRAHFGDQVAIFHSSLTTGEPLLSRNLIRFEAPRRLRSNRFTTHVMVSTLILDSRSESPTVQWHAPR